MPARREPEWDALLAAAAGGSWTEKQVFDLPPSLIGTDGAGPPWTGRTYAAPPPARGRAGGTRRGQRAPPARMHRRKPASGTTTIDTATEPVDSMPVDSGP